jgi:hypothetical protein
VKLASSRSVGASEALSVWVRDRDGRLGGNGPASVTAFRSRGLADTHFVRGGGSLAVVIVPDGVTRVTLGAFRTTLRGHQFGATLNLSNLRAAAAVVHENVAALEIGAITALGQRFRPAVAGVPAAGQMTWFGPNGKVINHRTIDFTLWVDVRAGS